jgi:hypothetical protein
VQAEKLGELKVAVAARTPTRPLLQSTHREVKAEEAHATAKEEEEKAKI